ncbi:MAG: RrF2 family transcriptional regulator [Eubacteriales bacterium]|nr:RrF2 family transcriptional regulator [Eubacteriales bacterium]
MMISSKGRYALRVMLDMAQQKDDGFIRLSDVAQRQEISRKYLESIMTALSKSGLVESALGKSGGYRLARAPADYPVGEILRAAEGELAPVACLAREGHKCDRVGFCYTLPFWKGLEDQINAYVNSFSLQDLLDLKDQEKENGCCVCGGKEDETR